MPNPAAREAAERITALLTEYREATARGEMDRLDGLAEQISEATEKLKQATPHAPGVAPLGSSS